MGSKQEQLRGQAMVRSEGRGEQGSRKVVVWGAADSTHMLRVSCRGLRMRTRTGQSPGVVV